MHRRLGRPPAESLSIEIERNATETPQRRQGHVQHDRLDKATFLHPRSDKLAEAVTPQILINCDRDKD